MVEGGNEDKDAHPTSSAEKQILIFNKVQTKKFDCEEEVKAVKLPEGIQAEKNAECS